MKRLNSSGRVVGRFLARVLPAVVLAGSLGACMVRGSGHLWVPGPVIVVEGPPPPPPRRTVVVTRPGYIYIEGRYTYSGNRYVWNDGYYERERAGHVYQPGRWQRRGNGHVWVEGRWEARGGNNGHGRDRAQVRDHRR